MKTIKDLLVMRNKAESVINSNHYGLKAKQLAKSFKDAITKKIINFDG